MIKHICYNCKRTFLCYPCNKQSFCSVKCKSEFAHTERKCVNCGKKFICYKHQIRRYCSHKCANASGNHNKGGRILDPAGYAYIWQPHHPNATGVRKYIHEHRLVMEKKLGRFLRKEEVVHHINGVRADNRLENLKLFPNQAEHIKAHKINKGVKYWGANKDFPHE